MTAIQDFNINNIVMEIACCIDDNFTMPCGVLLTSICENNLKEKLNFHIVSDDLSIKNQEQLINCVRKYKQNIRFYSIDSSIFSNFPISHHIKIAAYFRIMLPYIIPEGINKILYLDCDLIVRGNLGTIWEEEITNYAVGAVPNMSFHDIRIYNRLGYDMKKGYFNSGILLINLAYWRSHDITTQTLNYIRDFPEKCIYWDQDALNYVLQDVKKYLPIKCNVQTTYYHPIEKLLIDRYYWEEIERSVRNPLILHYSSPDKPWLFGCTHPYRTEFIKYLHMTQWRLIRLTPPFYVVVKKILCSIWRFVGNRNSKKTPLYNIHLPEKLEDYIEI